MRKGDRERSKTLKRLWRLNRTEWQRERGEAMKRVWRLKRTAMLVALRSRPMSAATKKVAEKIHHLHWEKNMSLRQAAAKLGMTYAGLQHYLRRYNLPRRGRVESMNIVFNGHGPNWKGGRINVNGYIQLKMPKHPNADRRGYVFEHRYVMAEKIGRPLREDEIVHHVNGVTTDNRVANLEIRFRHGKEKPHGHLSVCPHCHQNLH